MCTAQNMMLNFWGTSMHGTLFKEPHMQQRARHAACMSQMTKDALICAAQKRPRRRRRPPRWLRRRPRLALRSLAPALPPAPTRPAAPAAHSPAASRRYAHRGCIIRITWCSSQRQSVSGREPAKIILLDRLSKPKRSQGFQFLRQMFAPPLPAVRL